MSRTVRLTIPAASRSTSPCPGSPLRPLGVRPLAEETLADLKLALTEACSNSVRSRVRREGWPCLDQLRAAGRPPDRRGRGRRRRLRAEAAGVNGDTARRCPEGGLGIVIIRSIADEVEIGRRLHGRGSRSRFDQAPSLEALLESPDVSARRKLIVVSNRGPLCIHAQRRGARVVRRGAVRARDGPGAARLAPRGHVDRDALSEETAPSRPRARRRGDGSRRLALPASARRAPAVRLRPSTTTSSPIPRSGSCSTASGQLKQNPGSRPRLRPGRATWR